MKVLIGGTNHPEGNGIDSPEVFARTRNKLSLHIAIDFKIKIILNDKNMEHCFKRNLNCLKYFVAADEGEQLLI